MPSAHVCVDVSSEVLVPDDCGAAVGLPAAVGHTPLHTIVNRVLKALM